MILHLQIKCDKKCEKLRNWTSCFKDDAGLSDIWVGRRGENSVALKSQLVAIFVKICDFRCRYVLLRLGDCE